MKKFFLLFFVFSVLEQPTFAQSKRQFKEAETHFAYEEYALAIPLYEAYLEDEPRLDKIVEVSYKLGFSYLQTAQKGKALPHLELVYQQKPKYHKNLTYYLAQTYHFQHNWDKAEQFYKMAAKESEFAKEIPKHLQEIEYGRQYTKNPSRVVVENLGDVLNSPFPEYVPVISEDEKVLLFTSRRPSTTGGGKDTDQEYFEDIYISEKKDGKWTPPRNMPRPINGNSHDACIALSPDGKTLFVYKTGSGRTKMGDIYYSKRNEDGSWSDPKSMGDKINTKYREPSISITHDGNTVYFASDRPGGFGGLDIYKSTKNEKGEWGEPVNLGATINTPYDEDSPFIHNENTLYFSSIGHSSMGGYDIFVSELNGNEWSKPHNFGSPINTADDDIYFVVSADNKRGYFSSGRAGGLGDKDLYVIYNPERNYDFVKLSNTPPKITTKVEIDTNTTTTETRSYITILKGEIREARTKKKLEAEIALVNLADNYLEEELNSDAQTGKYQSIVPADRHYLISVDKEGYLFHSEEIQIPPQPQNRNQEIVVDIELLKLEKGAKINLKVFYDFDKDFLRSESVTELERLLKFLQKYPKMKVEISGHTDAIGTEAKNQGLSERRAKSVVRYLVEKGIDPKRLLAKGYGELRPIAPNDTPEGRQLNRRTECEVLDF